MNVNLRSITSSRRLARWLQAIDPTDKWSCTMRYTFKGKEIRKSQALAHVIDAFIAGHHQQPQEYFNLAHEQSSDGYLAREV